MAKTEKKAPTVFIAHSPSDDDAALRLGRDLGGSGMNVFYGFGDILPNATLIKKILEALSSRNFVIFLLSGSTDSSDWVESELTLAGSRELEDRAIELIPVLVDDCQVPVQLRNWRVIDLREDYADGLESLIERIVGSYELDLLKPKPESFERLVAELLWRHEFRPADAIGEQGFDLTVKHTIVDPFGRNEEETWLVQVKRYRDRIGLSPLKRFVEAVGSHPVRVKGLLVTNTRLTSVAREYLTDIAERARIDIRVIEGPELRRLLATEPELLDTHFPAWREE
jgi:hypothetical protein